MLSPTVADYLRACLQTEGPQPSADALNRLLAPIDPAEDDAK